MKACKKGFTSKVGGFFNKGLEAISKKLSITSDLMIQKSDTIRLLVGKKQGIFDNNIGEILKVMTNVHELRKGLLDKEQFNTYSSAINNYSKGLSELVSKLEVGEIPNTGTLFGEHFNKFDDEVQTRTRAIVNLFNTMYTEKGASKLFNFYRKDGVNIFEKMLFNMTGTIKNDALLHYLDKGIKIDGEASLKELLIKDISNEASEFGSKRTISNLANDLVGGSVDSILYKNATVQKVILNLRDVTSSFKFAFLPGSDAMFGVNAMIMGTFNYLSKKRGLENIMDSKELIDFADKFNILKSESRAQVFNEADTQGHGTTGFNRLIDFLFNKSFGKVVSEKQTLGLSTLIKGGSQAGYDMFMNESVKRLALAEAFGKIGVNEHNIGKFISDTEEGIKNGTIDKSIIDDIRAQTLGSYQRFFTTSSLIAHNRDRFSSWISLNYLQHYVTTRSSELIDGFRKLHYDVTHQVYEGAGRVSVGEYLDHNVELKAFIYNLVHTASAGYYVSQYLGGNHNTNDRDKVYNYALGMNDFFSSMSATVPYRIITSLFNYPSEYSDYKHANGESIDGMDRVTAATFGVVSDLTRSILRELKIGNIVTGTAGLYTQGFGYDIISNNINVMLNKTINGMGRFGAVEGFEKYGMKKVPSYDDQLGFYLMNIDQTNESLNLYSKLRTVEGVQQAITKGLVPSIKTLIQYSTLGDTVGNIVGLGFGTKINSEVKFNTYKGMIENDEVLRDLYNGNFNSGVLMKDGALDKITVDNIYKDMVRYNYNYNARHQKGNGVNKVTYSGVGFDQAKEEIFVQDVLDKIGEGAYMKVLAQGAGDIKKQGLLKILTMAELETVGSSRVVLSYMANMDYLRQVNNYNQTLKRTKYSQNGADNIPLGIQTAIKANVINKFYGTSSAFASDTDQSSWYKLIENRMTQLNPKAFKVDKSYQQYYNTLGLLDYVAYTEGKKANPDASFIKNIFAVSGKFISNPADKLKITNHVLKSINTLHTNEDVKTMLKTGVLVGNMNSIASFEKDPTFAKAHKKELDTFKDFMFTNNHNLNVAGTKLAIDGLGGTGKKQYHSNGGYTKYGSNKGGYPTNTKNANLVKTFKKNMPTVSSYGGRYKPQNSGGYTNLTMKPYANARLSRLSMRAKINYFAAKTQKLVNQGGVAKQRKYSFGKKVHIRHVGTKKKALI